MGSEVERSVNVLLAAKIGVPPPSLIELGARLIFFLAALGVIEIFPSLLCLKRGVAKENF